MVLSEKKYKKNTLILQDFFLQGISGGMALYSKNVVTYGYFSDIEVGMNNCQ